MSGSSSDSQRTDCAFMGLPERPPPPDSLGLDPRLLTAERMLGLAGQHRMRAGAEDDGGTWLDCAECGRGVTKLTDAAGRHWTVTPLGIVTDMLRHQVMRHDLPLSGGEG